MKYRVILETSIKNKPRDYELSAALILVEYFKKDVVFLRTAELKTPDFLIGDQNGN